jgi:5-formyltetrahydrofolate cyclo-ligase
VKQVFASKDEARQAAWDALDREGAARFPFPPHGRIPNFAGAEVAAHRLLSHPVFQGVKCIKANPDAPQRAVRLLALRRGITVIVPTPRLRGGFRRLDPARIPHDRLTEAASLGRGADWAEPVALEELPAVDLVVTGCAAATRSGKRCGKGHGYGDIEYAILRELGNAAVPVVTTVHALQIVEDFPVEAHDLPVSLIVTPDETIEVATPPPAPSGIYWDRLTREHFDAMPVLRELQCLKGWSGKTGRA